MSRNVEIPDAAVDAAWKSLAANNPQAGLGPLEVQLALAAALPHLVAAEEAVT